MAPPNPQPPAEAEIKTQNPTEAQTPNQIPTETEIETPAEAKVKAGELGSHKLYAITVFGYKKAGMSEEAYHTYISQTHAGHLKALLAREDIVSYTMQHNTRAVNEPLLALAYGDHLPRANVADCDAVIQIVFKDIEDYLRVRQDAHFVAVVAPDHANFADASRTRFAAGWFEVHVSEGRIVS